MNVAAMDRFISLQEVDRVKQQQHGPRTNAPFRLPLCVPNYASRYRTSSSFAQVLADKATTSRPTDFCYPKTGSFIHWKRERTPRVRYLQTRADEVRSTPWYVVMVKCNMDPIIRVVQSEDDGKGYYRGFLVQLFQF